MVASSKKCGGRVATSTAVPNHHVKPSKLGDGVIGSDVTDIDTWLSCDKRPVYLALTCVDVKLHKQSVLRCGREVDQPSSRSVRGVATGKRTRLRGESGHALCGTLYDSTTASCLPLHSSSPVSTG